MVLGHQGGQSPLHVSAEVVWKPHHDPNNVTVRYYWRVTLWTMQPTHDGVSGGQGAIRQRVRVLFLFSVKVDIQIPAVH